MPIGRHLISRAARGPARSPTSRSRSSKPSPTKRSSPSRTCGCSRSCKRRTAVRGPRAGDRVAGAADGDERDPSGDQRARQPTSSRCFDAIGRERRQALQRPHSAHASASTENDLHLVAHPLTAAELVKPFGASFPRQSRTPSSGRAILERADDSRTGHPSSDSRVSESAYPRGRGALGYRTLLAVPMIREDVPIGVIAVFAGREAEPSPTSRSPCSRPLRTRR